MNSSSDPTRSQVACSGIAFARDRHLNDAVDRREVYELFQTPGRTGSALDELWTELGVTSPLVPPKHSPYMSQGK